MRIYDERRRKINVGDILMFKHNTNVSSPELKTEIIEIKIYPSFREAIEDTGVKNLLPHVDSIEDAINTYEQFDNGNYKENAKKYGVVRFKIHIIE